MPLEDLIELGYEVSRPPEGEEPQLPISAGIAWGHDRQWILQPDGDEEALVQEATNHAALMDKLEQAQSYFADNYTNWASMTAPQKDTAARNAQRALANLIRHVRKDLTSGGV